MDTNRDNKINQSTIIEDYGDLILHLSNYKLQYPGGAVLLFVAEADSMYITEIQHIAQNLDYPVLGAVVPALIDEQGFRQHGILLLPMAVCPSYAIVDMSDAQQAPRRAVQRLVDSVRVPGGSEQATLCLLFDSMVPNVATLLDNLYLLLADRVNYAGINVGSETFQPTDCLFDNLQFTQNAVLAILRLEHEGALLEHCYQAHSDGLIASASAGNKVSHIDWRPALDVYQEIAKELYGISVNRDSFYEQAVHLPFGILRLDGEVLVRIPVALENDGSLYCVGEIPENSLLTLVEPPPQNSVKTVDKLAAELELRKFDSLVLFYCAGRRMHLNELAEQEVRMLVQRVPGRKLAGALSLGEISQSHTGNYPLFHNAAMVVCPWNV